MVGVVEGALLRSHATIPVIVDFLVHFRRDKGLSVSAVKGYRSALNSVFALKGMDLADSREISMLLRSFSKSAIPEELCPHSWDVALVLQSLTWAPYEPLQTSDERFLAQKTLFLLAPASAFRITSLTPGAGVMCPPPSWRRRRTPLLRFEGFTVPALPNSRTNRNGSLLCVISPAM